MLIFSHMIIYETRRCSGYYLKFKIQTLNFALKPKVLHLTVAKLRLNINSSLESWNVPSDKSLHVTIYFKYIIFLHSIVHFILHVYFFQCLTLLFPITLMN